MSVSSDSGHFFQSDSSLETSARRVRKRKELGDNGKPINLPTKVLAIAADPKSSKHVFAAEAGNVARRINLETDDISEIYRGHTAPVTCLTTNTDGTILFTGSWDKRVLAFSTETQEVLQTFTGHSDFAKALQYIPSSSRSLIATASSDASILIFNADTGERLYQLKSHARGVQCLALDPSNISPSFAVLYSGDSRRDIKRWTIPLAADGGKGAREDENGGFTEHDTGINKILFSGDPGEEDMWTASSDKTVKRFERAALPAADAAAAPPPKGGVKADTVLKHPDFVNDIVVDPTGRFVITACSDEEVRVWDVASGNLHHTFEGHWDVVTGLLVVRLSNQFHVISASLDCTIRRWSLTDMKSKPAASATQKGATLGGKPQGAKKAAVTMTEEEERELAELMEDDDEE